MGVTISDLIILKSRYFFGVDDAIELGQSYLELVRKKGYSMLHLISDQEYTQGLMTLEQRLLAGPIQANAAGETLVWFVKPDLIGK
jgi:hypothetical protein